MQDLTTNWEEPLKEETPVMQKKKLKHTKNTNEDRSQWGWEKRKINKWNCQSSAEWRWWHVSCKAKLIQWEIEVSKSKAISLPLPLPLPPSKKRKNKFICEENYRSREKQSAKDLELDTFKRQEGCLLYLGVYPLCLTPPRVNTQKHLLNEWMECGRESARD